VHAKAFAFYNLTKMRLYNVLQYVSI
jgi:hypothetical protein